MNVVENKRHITSPMDAAPTTAHPKEYNRGLIDLYFKGTLYRIWCGVNRLGDSGVKVV